nr:hypothetical protein CFP56_53656 [Quercus suber]
MVRRHLYSFSRPVCLDLLEPPSDQQARRDEPPSNALERIATCFPKGALPSASKRPTNDDDHRLSHSPWAESLEQDRYHHQVVRPYLRRIDCVEVKAEELWTCPSSEDAVSGMGEARIAHPDDCLFLVQSSCSRQSLG